MLAVAGVWLLRLNSELDGSDPPRIAFDSLKWKDPKLVYGVDPIRIQMVDDLMDRHALRGKTRTEIVELLGEPTDTDYFRAYDMVYWVGPERGFMGIDSEWLVFRLDGAGTVGEYHLVRD